MDVYKVDFHPVAPLKDNNGPREVCVYSRWVGVFSHLRARAAAVTQMLIERAFFLPGKTPRVPQGLGNPFYQTNLTPGLTLQHFHCTCHPQASGSTEQTEQIVKIHRVELVESLHLPWPKALLLVLLNLDLFPLVKSHCPLLTLLLEDL